MAERYYQINYEKSIQKQKLIYKISAGFVVSYVMDVIIILLFIGCINGPLLIKPTNISHISIYYYGFCFLFDAWIISNTILLNSFIKIDGKKLETNKKDILALLTDYYKLKNPNNDNPNIITDIRLTGLFRAGRVITCLFDNNIVYLNITRLLRYDSRSYFSGLYLYFKCKRIAKQFQQIQDNS